MASTVLYKALGSPAFISDAANSGWHAFTAIADRVAAQVGPIAESTAVLRVPALEAAVDNVSTSVGQDPTVVRYLLALLLAYPLALIFARLRAPVLKHLFSLCTGVLLAQFVFGGEWFHPLLQGGVAYALLLLTQPVAGALGVLRPLVLFAWLLGYLTVQHLYRLHTDYLGWKLDITGPTMILTIKISALAFQLYDGSKPIAALYAAGVEQKLPGKERVYRERQERAISRLPNPLEFFAFAFCFTSFFAGPAFDFKEYMSSVEEAPFREAPPAGSKGAAGSTDLHWGSRLKAAGGKLLLSLVFLGVNVTLGSRFNFNDVLGSSSELSLARQPMLLRIGIAWLCLLVTRSKYYFAWTISEGSSNLAGFGYQPSKGSWSGVRSIDVLGFELAPSVSASTRAWNMQTQSWLERYAHKRVPRSVNLWVTYALSAFWHGFYPGYYLAFATAPLATSVEKELTARVKPRVAALGSAAATAYDAVGRVIVSLTMNYTIMPFVALSFDAGMHAWGLFFYAGHAILIALLLLLPLIPRVKAPHHSHHPAGHPSHVVAKAGKAE